MNGLCETQSMCCMLWDVACSCLGLFTILSPTGILLENYSGRKEPKLGLLSCVLTTVSSICSPSCVQTLSREKAC